jgi:hypothetical protein
MGQGISRNDATVCANACGPEMPHDLMGFLVITDQLMYGSLLYLLTAFTPSVPGHSAKVVFHPSSHPEEILIRLNYE